ncbi:P63C domain-containing protein [Maribacter dokdonensis]|uniref:P63C domain-containing protein n=1 Tax=Maribacter dokdonensis TaxID=320912 RepID=UPI00327D76C4
MAKSEKKENIVKYDGVLELTDNISIDCYVLEDGTRVLSGNGMQLALNMIDENEVNPSGTRLARYLGQKSLHDYIYKGKEQGHYDPLICYRGEQKINGYEATVLVDICDAFLQARSEIKLSARQKIIADQCEILVRTFAKVGIIALIDESTGYQYDREKKELQTILKALVSDEILDYQKQFQLSFYREIFRLWDIPFTPQNIKRKPQFIGHLTNRYVYSNLPKGTFVLDKLKSKTPKTEAGNLKYRLHQSLTEDKGREALKKVLYTVEALASISKDKRDFERLINEKYGQKEIPFTDLETLDEPIKEVPKPSKFNKALKKGLEWNPNANK